MPSIGWTHLTEIRISLTFYKARIIAPGIVYPHMTIGIHIRPFDFECFAVFAHWLSRFKYFTYDPLQKPKKLITGFHQTHLLSCLI